MRMDLLERRQKMVKRRAVGVSLAEVVKELALEYQVSHRALYHDWMIRKKWLKTLLEIGDPETFFLDLVSSHREIYRWASLEYLKGDNSNARIGALRLLRDLNKDFYEMIVPRHIIQTTKSEVKVEHTEREIQDILRGLDDVFVEEADREIREHLQKDNP